MRLTTMTKCTAATFMIASSFAIGAQVNAAQTALRHSQAIDLSPYFIGGAPDSTVGFAGNGNSPLSLAFDGTNAYISGYNNSSSDGSVGVVKVSNVTGTGNVTVTDLGIKFDVSGFRGIDSMVYANDALYLANDNGTTSSSYIRKYDVSGDTPSLETEVNAPGRPLTIDYNPNADNISYVQYSQGRIFQLNKDTLTEQEGDTHKAIIYDPATGTAWRSVSFDSDGNVTAATFQGIVVGNLNGDGNGYRKLDDSGAGVTNALQYGADNNVWVSVDIVEDAGDSDLIAYTLRGTTEVTDSTGSSRSIDANNVYLANLDGSVDGLSQIELTGAEDGIGAAWQNDTKQIMYDVDAEGNGTLLVVSFGDERLDVYTFAAVPEPASMALLGAAGLLILGKRRRK
ncbi:hypothetical protein KS4_05360 [Poriferisphaera corsica]|uniref:Ice-binding protein C-terminal domain-containing protein n=1 Tax=Poriferisphaera corsica TaxID=2528020 RepID=A0A517YQL3_9BACT|nr:PEP-CTERM sorting domain-containing protein [Poriferisphaera corsica]QDU32504.1 hypothetical protein KS4_05360 [Poriferisphaera corsica]